MKLRTVALFSSFGIVIAGATMLFLANNASSQPVVVSSINSVEPKHPVTEAMMQESAAKANKQARYFQATDFTGKSVKIADTRAGKPQFVYFVVDGCPCSIDAEPLLQALYEHFDKRIDFVAVTNADTPKAKQWSFNMLMPYPLIPDPKLEIVRAYGAKTSVYSALLDKDGRIVKEWPGYSKGILEEMNASMADVLSEPVRPFDTKYAPEKKATGCSFSASQTQ